LQKETSSQILEKGRKVYAEDTSIFENKWLSNQVINRELKWLSLFVALVKPKKPSFIGSIQVKRYAENALLNQLNQK
jgi:hypothetical protein